MTRHGWHATPGPRRRRARLLPYLRVVHSNEEKLPWITDVVLKTQDVRVRRLPGLPQTDTTAGRH